MKHPPKIDCDGCLWDGECRSCKKYPHANKKDCEGESNKGRWLRKNSTACPAAKWVVSAGMTNKLQREFTMAVAVPYTNLPSDYTTTPMTGCATMDDCVQRCTEDSECKGVVYSMPTKTYHKSTAKVSDLYQLKYDKDSHFTPVYHFTDVVDVGVEVLHNINSLGNNAAIAPCLASSLTLTQQVSCLKDVCGSKQSNTIKPPFCTWATTNYIAKKD